MKHQLEMSPVEMREYGYRVIDYLVEHFESQSEKSPTCFASRSEMDELLPAAIPFEECSPNEVLQHVVEDVLSNCGNNSHPRNYAFVPGPSNFISCMGDALASGYNVFTGSWAAAPAGVKVEIILINWLLELFGLPIKEGGGVFTSGGSMANLTAIVTARRKLCGEDFSHATVYLSSQTHSSNFKALSILGFKNDQVRVIPVSSDFKCDVGKLHDAVTDDMVQGKRPLCVIASAGTTNTGTIDPLEAIADICKEHNLWLHVDAAFGGAAILSEHASLQFRGIERADSITVDPHKWFFQPYEIGCVLVRNRFDLSDTFTEKPEYLRDIEGNISEINFYDHGVQLTRNFKALKLYMSLKTFGLEAFKSAVDYSLNLASETETILKSQGCWEIISPATLAVIVFRFNLSDKEGDQSDDDDQISLVNQKISDEMTATGQAFLATTSIRNQIVLRMCLINPRATIDDVTMTIENCREIGTHYWLESQVN